LVDEIVSDVVPECVIAAVSEFMVSDEPVFSVRPVDATVATSVEPALREMLPLVEPVPVTMLTSPPAALLPLPAVIVTAPPALVAPDAVPAVIATAPPAVLSALDPPAFSVRALAVPLCNVTGALADEMVSEPLFAPV
jgi:hypothetical protein